ncbi:MAG: HNH endonuclease [Chloroflexota bacterium]|nr:HNH endonuclease [Chloroflexota bacterium]
MKPTREDFQSKLDEIFTVTKKFNLISVTIKAGNLHNLIEKVKDGDHRMPVCCDVMYQNMKPNDIVVSSPPKGKGTTLTIQYFLPR